MLAEDGLIFLKFLTFVAKLYLKMFIVSNWLWVTFFISFIIFNQLWKWLISVLIMFRSIKADHKDTQFNHNSLAHNQLVYVFTYVSKKTTHNMAATLGYNPNSNWVSILFWLHLVETNLD